MKGNKSKDNQARYDKESEVYVGPSSRPFNVAKVAQSAWFTHQPVDLAFSHSLSSSSSLAKLASRCSTKTIQDQVKERIEDREIVEAVRKRILGWGEPSEEKEAQPDKKRKRGQRGQAKKEKEKEASQLEEPLEEIDALVPNLFQIPKHPHLSSYFRRDTLLEQSCIKQPVRTQLLSTSRKVPLTADGKEETLSSSLVLNISIYARLVRGIWAKERVQRLANGDVESKPQGDSDSSTDKEDTKRAKAERGLYGPLQLVQKINVLSTSTLQDLRGSFLCRLDDLPATKEKQKEAVADVLPEYTGKKRKTDSCFLIEDELYSEWPNGVESYAILLEKHISCKASPKKMDQIRLDSLSLSTGKLYWFLHQGSCEHLWNITSLRALQKQECEKGNLFPQTTFYASGAAMSPLVKWFQPKSHVQLTYTLDKCDLCKGNQASLLVIGGSRFQSRTNINGLKQDTASLCQVCWYALCGEKPLASTSEDGDLSHMSPPRLPRLHSSLFSGTNCIALN